MTRLFGYLFMVAGMISFSIPGLMNPEKGILPVLDYEPLELLGFALVIVGFLLLLRAEDQPQEEQ